MHAHHRLIRSILAGVLMWLCADHVATAQLQSGGDVWVMIDRQLDTQLVELAAVESDVVLHRTTADGAWIATPQKDIVAFMRTEARSFDRRADQALLLLTDGQRLPGRFNASGQPREGFVRWEHDRLGDMIIPIERIAGWRQPKAPDAVAAQTEDVLQLRNGDRLAGFVLAIGPVMRIEVQQKGAPRDIALPEGDVQSIALINQPSAPIGHRLWLTDDTVVDVDVMRLTDDGRWHLESALFDDEQHASVLRWSHVAGVRLAGHTVEPFAALEVTDVQSDPTRYMAMPPVVSADAAQLGLASVQLRGPGSFTFALPEGATRFAARLELPMLARAYGNFELAVRIDGREVARGRLSAEQPVMDINFAVDGTALQFELIAGPNSPVHVQAHVLRGMVLLGDAASP
jgi:hypothetical protein